MKDHEYVNYVYNINYKLKAHSHYK
ncbi:TPA: hypothetical protein N6Z49_001053 [Escherichia coli]|nr:hypothetical protein [Escherichia coli]